MTLCGVRLAPLTRVPVVVRVKGLFDLTVTRLFLGLSMLLPLETSSEVLWLVIVSTVLS